MRKLVLFAALAIAASALAWLWFGRDTARALEADHPLHFVPADTPFVFASIEPMPEPVIQRWLDYSNAQINTMRMQLQEALRSLEEIDIPVSGHNAAADAAIDADTDTDAQTDAEADAPGPGDFRLNATDHVAGWIKALKAELDEASDIQALYQRFGFSLSPAYAFYAIDSIPVLRLQLQDPATFIAAIERLQKNGGTHLTTLSLDGIQAGWDFHFEHTSFSLIMAVIDRQLVIIPAPMTLDPLDAKHRYDPAILRPLLGLERPAKTLADSGQLQAMIRNQGYQPYFGGYIETAQIFRLLREPSTPLQHAFLSELDIQSPSLSPACEADIARLSTLFPRLTLGSTTLDVHQMGFTMRLNTASVITDALMQLRAPMPGRQAEDTSLVLYGMAITLQPLPDLGSRLANAAQAQPWSCPSLDWINEFSERGRSLNHASLYTIAPVLQSYVLALEDLSIDFTASKLRSLDAQLILGSNNPQSLIGSAQMLAPELKEFAAQLKPGAAAQPVPKSNDLLTQLGLDQPLMVALQDKALGLATGTQASARLDTLLAPAQPGPLLYISYSGAIYSRMAEILREYAGLKPEPDPALESMIQNFDSGYADFIDRIIVSIDIGEKGIEFEYRLKLK